MTSLACIKIRTADCRPHSMPAILSGFGRFACKTLVGTGFQKGNIHKGNDPYVDCFDT
ncbi:MAG: hypothetical protein OXD45_07235 [Rhodobacteraceae bacterium]|nr:hypothetical protein [Paracoccaceae bacterium]